MTRTIIAENTTATRNINNTEWPVTDRLVREQIGSDRPEWVIYRSLCNGAHDDLETYRTRKAALAAL